MKNIKNGDMKICRLCRNAGDKMCIRDRVKSKEKTMLRAISYVLTFSGGAVFGIAFLCLLQAGKGYPKKEE